jgi:DNA replication protein DnaC
MKLQVEILLPHQLKELKLSMMVKHYPSVARQAKESGWSYEEFLLGLTEVELQVRAENRLKRRVREAHFPLMKTLEGFTYEATPELDKRLIRDLASGEYIRERKNVILMGKSGTGKTHLAIALGIEACRQGLRTRFVSGSALANELIESRDEKRLSRIVQRYSQYSLLILDELGYIPFSKQGAELLFQVLAERHERGSIIITTNLGFADWTQVFGDPTLTAALLDRLTYKAHIITCSWESYRFKESLRHKQQNESPKKKREDDVKE